MKKTFLLSFAFCCSLLLFAQPQVRLIKVSVVPDSQDWNYALNKKAKFDISVTKNGIPVKDAEIRYELSYDMVCPSTSTYSVYNVIESPKTLCLIPEIEHYTYPEMWDVAWKWADQILGR